MMGRQQRSERLLHASRLEDHIPPDHLLRKLDRRLDLSFVRGALAEHYSPIGRPSVDPELLLRMLLVGYLHGIRSERRLCEEVHLNLAYRRFCKLGLGGAVPDASTFSENRHGRFRESGIPRELFERVVRTGLEAGSAAGEALSVDGGFLEAAASPAKRRPGDRLPEAWSAPGADPERPVREHLAALDAALAPAPDGPKPVPPEYRSPTDPQAAWPIKPGIGRFGYTANHRVDTARGVILDVEATPARASQETVAVKAMLERAGDRLALRPERLGADTGYGTGPFLAWLPRRGIEPHIPVLERKRQTKGKPTRDAFTHDAATDSFTCPEGRTLACRGADHAARVRVYRSRPKDCAGCPMRPSCTDGGVRTVSRRFDEEARDRARELAATATFAAMARQRREVEMLFAHLKAQFGLRRLRPRGLTGAAEQRLLAATAQNLRRLVRLAAPPAGLSPAPAG